MANTKNTPKAVVVTYERINRTKEYPSAYAAVKALRNYPCKPVAGEPHLTKFLKGEIKNIKKLSDLNITVAYKK